MSVTFDAAATANNAGSSIGSLSWTHTPVGTPTAVAVCIHNYPSNTIASVTYGGVTMTLASSSATMGNGSQTYIYGLANPPAGPQTVVINYTGVAATYVGAASVTVLGSDTTTCFRASGSTIGAAATSSSLNVASATGDLVIDIIGTDSSLATITPGGSQTSRSGVLQQATDSSDGSSQPGGASSTTMTWTFASSDFGVTAASFQVGSGGGTRTPTLALMGVG